MKNLVLTMLAVAALGVTVAAHADEYNTVPPGDAQYAQCKSYSNNKYSGGGARSPIDGQTKVEAFCTCAWNETPDNFRGNLASFAETARGATMNKICEKYSDWSSE